MVNISQIVKNGTCTQCGTCIAVCPEDAIELYQHSKRGLLPRVDEDKCTKCKKCVKVCPGEELSFEQLNLNFFGKLPENELYGNFINVYTSYAKDAQIRYNGASGGVVTALLNDLIEHKEIDGALVVKMSSERPLEPEVFIARTRAELVSAQQSKYLPVPMNIGLKQILNEKHGRYAVVGLPCHFHGLLKAEKLLPKIKERIVLRIGLFCGFNPTLSSTKFLLRRAGVKNFDDIKEIKYRDGDWPCGFRAYLKDGTDRYLYPIRHFLFSHYVFERHRCAMCADHLCEFADLSMGDEWRADLKDDASGWSFIITRTEAGEKAVEKLLARKIISAEKIDKEVIFSGQGSTMIFKKRGNQAFANIKKFMGKKIPDYFSQRNQKPKFKYYIGSLSILFMTTLFEQPLLSRMFQWLPTKIFTKYRHLILKVFKN